MAIKDSDLEIPKITSAFLRNKAWRCFSPCPATLSAGRRRAGRGGSLMARSSACWGLRERPPRWHRGPDTAGHAPPLIRSPDWKRRIFISICYLKVLLHVPSAQLPVVASQHDKRVPSPHSPAHGTRQHLVGRTHIARRVDVHVGLVVLNGAKAEVTKVIDGAVWGQMWGVSSQSCDLLAPKITPVICF